LQVQYPKHGFPAARPGGGERPLMTESIPADETIAYFAHLKQGSAYVGALVVVTYEGDPVDFAYTDPVSLNRFSLQLLGARADGYMIARVLLEPLLKQVKGPGVVCFDEPHVLLRRPVGGPPSVVFAPADAAHKYGAWSFHEPANGAGPSEGFWVSPAGDSAVPGRLHKAAAVMAPFALREPFQKLRAAMGELGPPAAK
jgi:hypothetical protein